jgi:uncharacterized protein (DUF1778 family)
MPRKAERRLPTRKPAEDETLVVRVPAALKGLFQRAADMEGVTLSDYMISTLVERSRATIREHEVITLAGRNRDVFVAALQNPPPLAPKLAVAVERLERLA